MNATTWLELNFDLLGRDQIPVERAQGIKKGQNPCIMICACKLATEDCKLVVTCKMQNRNATDKLNQQCVVS